MAKNALKLSTMVGENLEIHLPQMAKNAPMARENLEIFHLKWSKSHFILHT